MNEVELRQKIYDGLTDKKVEISEKSKVESSLNKPIIVIE